MRSLNCGVLFAFKVAAWCCCTSHYIELLILLLLLLFLAFIQRIGCQPEKLLYTMANPAARGLLNRKKNKSGSALAPPRAARSEKIKIKITRRIHA